MANYKRLDGETDEELIYRVCNEKDLIGTWDDVAKILNDLTGNEYTESRYRKQYQAFQKLMDANKGKILGDNKYVEEIRNEQNNLAKERAKLQTERLELNRWVRENARDELLIERIADAITNLQPLDAPTRLRVVPSDNAKSYLLAFGDCHFGIEFEVMGLHGDIINAYSPEIFKNRMEMLFSKVVNIIEREGIDRLEIFELGDSIQGILRLNSQLSQLKYGIVESSILYAEYMATWINALSSYTDIRFQMVRDSNHSQLRICNAPKNAFPDENMGTVINAFLKERLKNNEHVTIIDNPTGMNYASMCGWCVLGIHGEVKNLATACNDYARVYGHPIDYLIGGHAHHAVSNEIGQNAEVIGVRSIIGTDPYGMSLRKTSDAGASLLVFDELEGLNCEYKIKL